MTLSKPLVLVVALAAAGATYGFFSAEKNRNPVRFPDAEQGQAPPEQLARVREWHPSPVWLPSWLVCEVPRWKRSRVDPVQPQAGRQELPVVGAFLENVNDRGYAFVGKNARSRYSTASMAVGAGLGILVAVMIGLATGWITVKGKEAAES